jgi:hypothetical protein
MEINSNHKPSIEEPNTARVDMSLDGLVIGAASVHNRENRTVERENSHFTLRVTIRGGLVDRIELEFKRDGAPLLSYTATGQQPGWFSMRVLAFIKDETNRAQDNSFTLEKIWNSVLSAPHLNWTVDSPIGASHAGLLEARALAVFPTLKELALNPAAIQNFFVCQKNERGVSTAIVGRAMPKEDVAILLTSQLSDGSAQPETYYFTIPSYTRRFTSDASPSPTPHERLTALQNELESHGWEALSSMLERLDDKPIQSTASENIKATQETLLQQYRAAGPVHAEFTDPLTSYQAELYIGVRTALIITNRGADTATSTVTLRLECGEAYECLTAGQIDAMTMLAQSLATGTPDQLTSALQQTFWPAECAQPALPSDPVLRARTEESQNSIVALRGGITAPDPQLATLLGQSVAERLLTIRGIALSVATLSAGLPCTEYLHGIRKIKFELPETVTGNKPHLWNRMLAKLHSDGGWSVEACNALHGSVELHMPCLEEEKHVQLADAIEEICQAFAAQTSEGEASFRSTLRDIGSRLLDADGETASWIKERGTAPLDDPMGLMTYVYCGRLLSRLSLLKQHAGSVMASVKQLGMTSCELTLETEKSPFFARLWLLNGKIAGLGFGISRQSNDPRSEWPATVWIQSLDIPIGSPACQELEDTIATYFGTDVFTVVSLKSALTVRLAESPLLDQTRLVLSKVYPQGFDITSGDSVPFILQPKSASPQSDKGGSE